MTLFNRYEDTAWPPQCHNFDSTAGAGGFTAGAAAPAVNMLEEALVGGGGGGLKPWMWRLKSELSIHWGGDSSIARYIFMILYSRRHP